jgi:hypothetical protein
VTLPSLHAKWLARLPKGTRIKATFELTSGDAREPFEIVCANECLISIGSGEARRGFIRPDLASALGAIVDGTQGHYATWKLDAESVTIEQAPRDATRAQVRALLVPLLEAVLAPAT